MNPGNPDHGRRRLRAPMIALVAVAGCQGSIEGLAPGTAAAGPEDSIGSTPASIPGCGTGAGRVGAHRLNRVEYNNTVRDYYEHWTQPDHQFAAERSVKELLGGMLDAVGVPAANSEAWAAPGIARQPLDPTFPDVV